jgi:hypothetical protein
LTKGGFTILTFEEVLNEARKLKPHEKRRLSEILKEETPKTIEEISGQSRTIGARGSAPN